MLLNAINNQNKYLSINRCIIKLISFKNIISQKENLHAKNKRKNNSKN